MVFQPFPIIPWRPVQNWISGSSGLDPPDCLPEMADPPPPPYGPATVSLSLKVTRNPTDSLHFPYTFYNEE